MSTVLGELRAVRRRRRLGDTEWFDVAYRAYLAALVGGAAVAWLSDLVVDEPLADAQVGDVTAHGPAWLGLVAAVAIALGCRSGSDGGPVSLEAGDARHLMLAPVPRRRVLVRPLVQRMRAVAFGGALAGAIAGQLASRRLPGSAPAWAASGAVFGITCGLAFVATAAIVHATALRRAWSTAAAVAVLGWQGAAAASDVPGPLTRLGSLAMWGMRTEPLDVVAAAVVVATVVVALVLSEHLRLEPLTRRAELVTQLRFAATMQDLRTVVLLRRQLRGERPRQRPWLRLRLRGSIAARPTGAVVARDLRSLVRFPASRLARMTALAAAAGLAAVAVERGTTPALVLVGFTVHLLGMEALEPLSQEIDHPDLSDGVPRERAWLLVRHLPATGLALVPFALVAAATVIAVDPTPGRATAALVLCVPVIWAGACGAVVAVVRDAPDPLKPSVSATAVPPEFAGFTSSIRLLIPLAISTICAVTVLAMREAPSVGQAVRVGILDALVIAATVWWVLRRDALRASWRRLLEGGRQERAAAMGGGS